VSGFEIYGLLALATSLACYYEFYIVVRRKLIKNNIPMNDLGGMVKLVFVSWVIVLTIMAPVALFNLLFMSRETKHKMAIKLTEKR
jgi:hypothetical protein